MGMKQQAKKENHFDLTCVALVLFTRWLLKGTTHKAPESSTSPGWGGHTGQPELCWLTGEKRSSHCPRSTAPSSPSIPQGSAILGMQRLFTVTGRSAMLLLTREEGAATVIPHTCPGEPGARTGPGFWHTAPHWMIRSLHCR